MDRRVSIDGFDMAVLMRGTVLNAQRGYAAALRDRAKRDMRQANQGDIFLFDGIFLHRPELRDYWDLSIYLDVQFEQSIPRLAARDGGPSDLDAPLNRRYIEGQQNLRSFPDLASSPESGQKRTFPNPWRNVCVALENSAAG